MLAALGGWPGALSRLLRREDLTAEEAEAVFDSILSGEAAPTQIAAFAAAMRTKGETSEEMIGLVRAMRARGEKVELGPGLLDTCGTGGDRSGTVNVSTMAALVAAAAGVRVCKHGGRASSSISGSADVFEALGVAVDLGPAGVARCVAEAGIGFCLAPRFHPAMRHAAPVRRELGVPTVFNFLGPLANPARATHQLIGVGDPAMAERMLDVLEANGTERAMLVYGHDGLDELSTVAISSVLETRRSGTGGYERRRYEVDAAAFGLARAEPGELRGGTPEQNASLLLAVFEGERGPQRDFALLNSAGALLVAGVVPDLGAGVELAASLIDEGAARAKLEQLVKVSSAARQDGA
ncbi:MAG TPA: anthranilate phosphoribosyltransferase [Acidimicrobiales bacterium]|nr:anthranilate phosphoribosyltransferase [Acidimicrobiales bacterium]